MPRLPSLGKISLIYVEQAAEVVADRKEFLCSFGDCPAVSKAKMDKGVMEQRKVNHCRIGKLA
jgi:hypothetical protein